MRLERAIRELRRKIHAKKWESLKKRGFRPPRDEQENKRRAYEAHHA